MLLPVPLAVQLPPLSCRCILAPQGSDSDEEVSSKKRKATKRRSTRTQGGKKQSVSLSKNFTEVRQPPPARGRATSRARHARARRTD
eukprot:COSAG06_NODE_14531_length_1149_cov_1.420000_2_plen_87_part_00